MTDGQIRFCEGLTANPPAQTTSAEISQLQVLLQQATFWAQDRTQEGLQIAIAHSNPVISVWVREIDLSSTEHLIGFARATSDGIYRATIWDVVIHPDYRGQGLGGQLLKTLLAHPQMNCVERIYLMTTHQQAFYERMGFTQNSTATMMLHQPVNSVSQSVSQSSELIGEPSL
jgi:ribosomal protein S18 acetylase RimI-like enzyme